MRRFYSGHSLQAVKGQSRAMYRAHGAEGGLGHLAIQHAKVMELRITTVDGGAEKEKLCLSLGAGYFIDYTST